MNHGWSLVALQSQMLVGHGGQILKRNQTRNGEQLPIHPCQVCQINRQPVVLRIQLTLLAKPLVAVQMVLSFELEPEEK